MFNLLKLLKLGKPVTLAESNVHTNFDSSAHSVHKFVAGA